MAPPTSKRLTVELEYDGEGQIAGRVHDAAGAGRDFAGWLGLAAAIDQLAAASGTIQDHPG